MLCIIGRGSALAAGLALSIGAASSGAPQAVRPDLSRVASGQGWTVVRRAAQSLADADRSGVALDAREGDGIAWLEGSDFDRGVIELDLKGKDVAQQSFLGVAFRGVDDTTYDTVYFRPFNFTAADPASRAHSVQYDSRPDHHWPRLRADHPGVYESAIDPAPDPDAWFHVRIVVDRPEVRVHVNGAEKPCLTVKELSGRAGGRIGLWVGANSDGLFANLTVAAAAQDDDQRAIERAIRDSIGWASTKDRALLESVLARDERLFMFQPESGSTVAGWTRFARQFDFWMDPRFKATTFEIRDLRVDRSRSGDVAWWSCFLDDFGEWDGRPIGWKDARWTGVLEKRDGQWVIAQMHFSFAADAVRAEAGRFPELSGPYLGQKPPGPTPEVFAPGIISTGRFERDVAVSPGGDVMYFGASGPGYLYTTVLATRLVNGRWTEPEVVPHLDDPRHLDLEPALSPDGNRLFFLSTRPNAAAGAARNQDIWVMTKTAGGWSEPENLGAPVNTDLAEYFPSITRDHTIYFTREEAGSRVSHIWRARLAGGRYQEAEKLPAQVNSGRSQFNAFIAPDESYLIVPVDGRDDSIGGCDYYVVFRTPDDRWSEPINLGPAINSEGSQEFSPYVSPDGKYFFFMATRLDRPERLSYRLIRDLHGRPRNGNADIYWVDAGVVTSLRSKAVFKPLP